MTNTPSIERLKELLAKAPALPWIIGDGREIRAHVGDGTMWFGSLADDNANRLAVEAVNALPHLLATLETLTPSAGEVERVDQIHEIIAEQLERLGPCWMAVHKAAEKIAALTPPLEQPDIEGRARLVNELREMTDEHLRIHFVGKGCWRCKAADSLSLPTTEIRREACRMCNGAGGVNEAQGEGVYVGLKCPQCFGFGSEEIVDLISDALDNSMGPDWSTRLGAQSVADALSDEGFACPPSRPSFDKWDYAREVLDAARCGR